MVLSTSGVSEVSRVGDSDTRRFAAAIDMPNVNLLQQYKNLRHAIEAVENLALEEE